MRTAPRVLIFYSTKGRSESADEGDQTYAEQERDCVKTYFTARNFSCVVKKDPTENDIFSNISKAQADGSLSCLVVFVMCHGEKGLVSVEGTPNYLMVKDIMMQMCIGTTGKPKVVHISKFHHI